MQDGFFLRLFDYLSWRWHGSHQFLKKGATVYFVHLYPSVLESFLEKGIVSAIGNFCFYAEKEAFLVFGECQDFDHTKSLKNLSEKCSKEMMTENVFFAGVMCSKRLKKTVKKHIVLGDSGNLPSCSDNSVYVARDMSELNGISGYFKQNNKG